MDNDNELKDVKSVSAVRVMYEAHMWPISDGNGLQGKVPTYVQKLGEWVRKKIEGKS